ncbi:MAG: nucleotide exchange factor GrpE [Fidelibacterota bacterium]|nr:MAG: nucleotide exchange factor GrpE [Candidatus Neomarinimicrobiota bacterium]
MSAKTTAKSEKASQPKAAEHGKGETADRKSKSPKNGTAGKPPEDKSVPITPEQLPDSGAKIKQLEVQFHDLEEKYLRLRAEYDNHIKRTNKEKSELISYAGSQFFRLMLPILDDLQRTIEHALQDQSGKDDPIIEGLTLTVEKFTKVLESEGVERFESVGEEFDPDLHEALMTKSSNEHPPGVVLEEFEPGYRYRDKVLRHAKVIVNE